MCPMESMVWNDKEKVCDWGSNCRGCESKKAQ
jgi:hypothetical protein